MTFRRFGGLQQNLGDLAMDPESATEIVNMDLHPVGEARTRGGLTAVEASPAGATPIYGLAFLEGSDGRFLYAAKGTALHRTSQADPWNWGVSPAHTWTNAITKARFVTAAFGSDSEMPGEDAHPSYKGPAIYAFTGSNLPWVDWGTSGQALPAAKYDTTVAANRKAGYPKGSSTGATEWRDWSAAPPTGACLIGRGTTEQMLAWGFADDPNRIDYTALRMPWHWGRVTLTDDPADDDANVDGGWFYAIADESDVLVGVVQHMGRIIVLKSRTTIVYSGLPGVDLAIENIYPVGCTSYESVARIGTNLAWWSPEGPVTLYGVQEFGNLAYSNVGLAVKDEVAGMTTGDMASIHALHDRKNFRVIWFVRRSTDASSRAVVYYYDKPQRWTVFSGKFCGMYCSLAAEGLALTNTSMYAGYRDGTLYITGTGSDDDGDPIAAAYETAWQAVQETELRKRLMFVEVMLGDSGAIDMQIDVSWDYSSLANSLGTVAKTLGDVAGVWDVALWAGTSDTMPVADGIGVWNATTKMVVRYEATGTGFLYKIRFSSDGGFPMQLAGWRAMMEAKGSR